MKIGWLSLAAAICGLLCGPQTPAPAQEAAGGPRIKFLDDLRCPFTSSSGRDPYEERIETERHDFTQSTKTVGCGVVQVEGGYSYFYKDHEEEIEHSHTTPEMLVRVGLSDDIEFRLRWDYAWRSVDVAEDEDAAEDLRWSFKLGVTDQDVCVPESALEVRFTAPTGGSAWTSERVDFGLDYIYGWEIVEGWGVYGSTGFSTNGLGEFGLLPEEPARDHFTVWSQSAAISSELTDRTTFYLEYFGLFSCDLEDNFTMHVFNLGVDFYVTRDLVLDLRVGHGLSDDADDFFVGVGGGYRF